MLYKFLKLNEKGHAFAGNSIVGEGTTIKRSSVDPKSDKFRYYENLRSCLLDNFLTTDRYIIAQVELPLESKQKPARDLNLDNTESNELKIIPGAYSSNQIYVKKFLTFEDIINIDEVKEDISLLSLINIDTLMDSFPGKNIFEVYTDIIRKELDFPYITIPAAFIFSDLVNQKYNTNNTDNFKLEELYKLLIGTLPNVNTMQSVNPIKTLSMFEMLSIAAHTVQEGKQEIPELTHELLETMLESTILTIGDDGNIIEYFDASLNNSITQLTNIFRYNKPAEPMAIPAVLELERKIYLNEGYIENGRLYNCTAVWMVKGESNIEIFYISKVTFKLLVADRFMVSGSSDLEEIKKAFYGETPVELVDGWEECGEEEIDDSNFEDSYESENSIINEDIIEEEEMMSYKEYCEGLESKECGCGTCHCGDHEYKIFEGGIPHSNDLVIHRGNSCHCGIDHGMFDGDIINNIAIPHVDKCHCNDEDVTLDVNEIMFNLNVLLKKQWELQQSITDVTYELTIVESLLRKFYILLDDANAKDDMPITEAEKRAELDDQMEEAMSAEDILNARKAACNQVDALVLTLDNYLETENLTITLHDNEFIVVNGSDKSLAVKEKSDFVKYLNDQMVELMSKYEIDFLPNEEGEQIAVLAEDKMALVDIDYGVSKEELEILEATQERMKLTEDEK